jgi:hypothetical protein
MYTHVIRQTNHGIKIWISAFPNFQKNPAMDIAQLLEVAVSV